MNKLIIFSLTIFSIISSCTKKESDLVYSIKKLENTLEIKIPYKCKLVDYNTDWAFWGGDYTESFMIQFSKDDFTRLINNIDSSRMIRSPKNDCLYYSVIDKNKGHISIICLLDEYKISYSLNYE